jgi:hypothetical protein
MINSRRFSSRKSPRDSGAIAVWGVCFAVLLLSVVGYVADTLQIARVTRGLQREADAMALAMASQLKPISPSTAVPSLSDDQAYLKRLEAYLRAKRAAGPSSRENPVFGDGGMSFYVGTAGTTPLTFGVGNCVGSIAPTQPCYDSLAKDPYDMQYETYTSADAVDKIRQRYQYEISDGASGYLTYNMYPYAHNRWTVAPTDPDKIGLNEMTVTVERGFYNKADGNFYSLEGALCASPDGKNKYPNAQKMLDDAGGANNSTAVKSYQRTYSNLASRSQICSGSSDEQLTNSTKVFIAHLGVCCKNSDMVSRARSVGNPIAGCNASGLTRVCPPPSVYGAAAATRNVFEVANAARVSITLKRVPSILPQFGGIAFHGSISVTAVAAPDELG